MTWGQFCQQDIRTIWDVSWWEHHVKHINPAYTSRFHHPYDKAKTFYPIEKTPPVSPEAQLTQVSHMQALNLLQDSQVAVVMIVDQPMDQSGSSTAQTQIQPVTLVTFASTTQVRMDTVVPLTVSQTLSQVPPVWVPLSQITSVASSANVAASLISQQPGTSAATQPQQQTDAQCRKCGKKNHSTAHCHKKVTCKQCKGKDHSTKFCTMPSQQEPKCTFCRKKNIPQRIVKQGRKLKRNLRRN